MDRGLFRTVRRMIGLDGVPPSAEIRADLAPGPVLLAFSRGKDSICTWLALRDAGVDVVPFSMYRVPGLGFVEDSLAYYEEWFGRPILRLPHPALYRWLQTLTMQPPERVGIIEAAQLPTPSYEDIVDLLREDQGMPGAWCADGVRACDSIVRRVSIITRGPMKESTRKVSAIWDWQIADVRERIAEEEISLPPDYEWFGRSFDGLDRRFVGPLAERAPGDYARILEWFPLVGMELWRADLR